MILIDADHLSVWVEATTKCHEKLSSRGRSAPGQFQEWGDIHELFRETSVEGQDIVIEPIRERAHEAVHELPLHGLSGYSLSDPSCFVPIAGRNVSTVHYFELSQILLRELQLVSAHHACDKFEIDRCHDGICALQLRQ